MEKKIKYFRKKYPVFVYQRYLWKISKNNLEIFFDFKIEPNLKFRPKIKIKNIKPAQIKRVGEEGLCNLAFHLGLIEILTYWKTTISPQIIIKAGFLNEDQAKWWKETIINGMGQFFYENRIDWRGKNFLKITAFGNKIYQSFVKDLKDRYLVPIGGGKDSIVTLEKLKERKKEVNCFLVNPTKFAKRVIKIAKIKNPILVERKIDPFLLELNKKGFLNGHTPFTALLSFLAVACGILFDYKNIAFSNEKSADEGNLKYLGKIINHQWSKSSQFEKKFKYYSQKYVAKKINYFSFLRKHTELEISQMFLKYPQYFSAFSSCNQVLAKKLKKRWCQNCPKCLFVYATLYPFLPKKDLLKIFGRDIFENKNLLPTIKDLIEKKRIKPFECVGTKEEAKLALLLSLKKAKKEGKLPYLLKKIEKELK